MLEYLVHGLVRHDLVLVVAPRRQVAPRELHTRERLSTKMEQSTVHATIGTLHCCGNMLPLLPQNTIGILQNTINNANQCSSITSLLLGYNPKASGAWEQESPVGVWGQGPHEPGGLGGLSPSSIK